MLKKPAPHALGADVELTQIRIANACFRVRSHLFQRLFDKKRGAVRIFCGPAHFARAKSGIQSRFKIVIKLNVLAFRFPRPTDGNTKYPGRFYAHIEYARIL
ncbi:hypothetical protein D3C78_1206440 [compost metagenome]